MKITKINKNLVNFKLKNKSIIIPIKIFHYCISIQNLNQLLEILQQNFVVFQCWGKNLQNTGFFVLGVQRFQTIFQTRFIAGNAVFKTIHFG